MSKRKSYNPERKDWKGTSYKNGKRVKALKEQAKLVIDKGQE
jgi:hypothetical protein